MKVYVALYEEWVSYEGGTMTILGVYTTKELAESRCGTTKSGHDGIDHWEYSVEEFTLDAVEVHEGE